MRTIPRLLLLLVLLVGMAAFLRRRPPAAGVATDLVGEWRAQLQFSSGAFAPIKDLEFMYVFN